MAYAKKQNPVEAGLQSFPYSPGIPSKTLSGESRLLTKKILGDKKGSFLNGSVHALHDLAEASDLQIKRLAKVKAKHAKTIFTNEMNKHGGTVEGSRASWVELYLFVIKHGIEPPDSEKHGVMPACNRIMDAGWWRKRLRVKQARTVEKAAIHASLVNKFKQTYVSDRTDARRRVQRDRNSRILENITATNGQEQEYTLKSLSDLSVSNPTLRRIELMTRINGFEQYAKLWGDVGEFYTITCPSKMHPSPLKCKGGKNPNYDGSTPRDAQQYLTKQWEKARAKLHRAGVEVYGFRVVEPQHDGTPHWHLLLFMNPNHVLFVRSVLLHYALQVDGKERGAAKYRFKPEAIKTGVNPKTGKEYSAAGYIAKYISKAIDGYGIDTDLFGNDAVKAAQRIEAWASTWNIRQFQQIGGASVTVWRELRRLCDDEINGSELLERARQCANEGDWCGYLMLNWSGQVQLLKKDSSGVGKYGDEKQMSVYGVEAGGVGVVTRRHTWTLSNGGEAATAQAAEPSSTWTGVNNCTREQLETAIGIFKRNYQSVHHARVQQAIKWGFEPVPAFEQVKRDAVGQILEDQFGIKGQFQLEPEFFSKLRGDWERENPRELLLEEFGEILFDDDWGEFEKFKENHFSGFVGDLLWKNYGVRYETAS